MKESISSIIVFVLLIVLCGFLYRCTYIKKNVYITWDNGNCYGTYRLSDRDIDSKITCNDGRIIYNPVNVQIKK